MIKSVLCLFMALLVSATAFAPQMFGLRQTQTALEAKHVNDKAAKWAKAKRPRKSRPSDINRTPIVYAIHSYEKPAEFTIDDAPASPAVKPSAATPPPAAAAAAATEE